MHDAPSVSYPVGRSLFMARALGALWLLGGAVLTGWALQAAGPDWRQGLGLTCWLAGGWCAFHAWWRSPIGTIEWDGASWHFASCEIPAPRVALDLQGVLLLHACLESKTLWLWAARRTAPSYWDALRRAVYSRARQPRPHGAQPPAAST